jgi:hypothetical protein
MARSGVRLREERVTMRQLIDLARLAEARGYESIGCQKVRAKMPSPNSPPTRFRLSTSSSARVSPLSTPVRHRFLDNTGGRLA